MMTRPTSEHELTDAIAENLAASWSPRTVATYRGHLGVFLEWCAERGVEAAIDLDADSIGRVVEPVSPELVVRYVTERDLDGMSASTIKLDLAALAAAHRDANLPDPTKDRDARRVAKGIIKRHAGRGQRQAAPLTVAIIERMEAADLAPRDVGLAWLLFDAALRIGEAAELRWDDLTFEPDGSGRVRIRRSKTDAAGKGEIVAISPRAVRALRRMYQGEPDDAPVFHHRREKNAYHPFTRDRLRMRLRCAGQRVGVVGLTGHSGRVGFARRLAEQGAPLHVTMRAGRWKTADVVAGYVRGIEASEVLRYLES